MRLSLPLSGLCVIALLAGCGGKENVVHVTVTTHTGLTTADTVTAPTVPTAPTTPTTPTDSKDVGAPLDQRLPPARVVPGMDSAQVKHLPTPDRMVGELFKTGDPTAPAATARLRAAGYENGYLRDQKGLTPLRPLLVRTYVMRLRDESTARAEVETAIQEVKDSSTVTFTDVPTEGSYAKGIKAKLPNDVSILFVTWAAGRDLYGIQVIGTRVYQADVLKAVSQNHLAWS